MFYVFQEDVAFNSPGSAAVVVYVGNQNGRLAWKIKGWRMHLVTAQRFWRDGFPALMPNGVRVLVNAMNAV
jgi:hypothetical protein